MSCGAGSFSKIVQWLSREFYFLTNSANLHWEGAVVGLTSKYLWFSEIIFNWQFSVWLTHFICPFSVRMWMNFPHYDLSNLRANLHAMCITEHVHIVYLRIQCFIMSVLSLHIICGSWTDGQKTTKKVHNYPHQTLLFFLHFFPSISLPHSTFLSNSL